MLQSKEIILRDLRESDIEKRLYWETVETEWQRWDAPWEFEGVTGSQKQEQLRALEGFLRMCAAETMPEGMKRRTFHMETLEEEPRYIGWVISYYINENCVFTTNITNRCAVGIDIPDRSARGKGYAYQALCLYMDYLFAHGETDLYTQTWSGNQRMVHIAETMGFEECCRKRNQRIVQGKMYDGLTFRLNQEKYAAFKAQMAHKLKEPAGESED